MLERECIQSRGFRNIMAGENVIGFEVAIRLTYYRGVWLSQLRPATVIVDGETFSGSQIAWRIGGKTYEQDQMAAVGDVNWDLLEPATLFVRKAGGLSEGLHDIEVKYTYSASYMPPAMDELFGRLAVNRRMLVLIG